MNLDLDAIEAAEKAMTPGPWLFDGWQRVRPADGPQDGTNDVAHIYSSSSASGYSAGDKANGEGIVLLRNSAPAIFARIRELETLCGKAAEAIRTLEDTPHYIATEYESLRASLHAASKGEQ